MYQKSINDRSKIALKEKNVLMRKRTYLRPFSHRKIIFFLSIHFLKTYKIEKQIKMR